MSCEKGGSHGGEDVHVGLRSCDAVWVPACRPRRRRKLEDQLRIPCSIHSLLATYFQIPSVSVDGKAVTLFVIVHPCHSGYTISLRVPSYNSSSGYYLSFGI
jgi:hypothetical protein